MSLIEENNNLRNDDLIYDAPNFDNDLDDDGDGDDDDDDDDD